MMLAVLPDKPAGKTGWPWDEETDPSVYVNSSWPRISIITPSFNQGQYLEETIRSILLQNYPALEYIIIDGGSTDGTVDLIRKYEPWITSWVSERDRGQTHAINKGLRLATGEIINWINSDDYLAPGALHHIATAYQQGFDLLAGQVYNFHDQDETRNPEYTGVIRNLNFSIKKYFNNGGFYFHQPGVWLKRALLEGMTLDEQLHYCFDTDLVLRLLEKKPVVVYSDRVLVHFRLHPESKTQTLRHHFEKEFAQIHERYTRHPDPVIAADARRLVDETNWRNFVNDLRLVAAPKWQKAKILLRGMAQQPATRLNRFSLGALRKILFN